MMKILFVSEALGEPNHKRGIFHFTRDLVRSLAAEGCGLSLLVEVTPRYRKLRRRQQSTRVLSPRARLIGLLALYRFLDEADMAKSAMRSVWRRRLDWIRAHIHRLVSFEFVTCLLRAFWLLPVRVQKIDNEAAGLAYIPPELRHLGVFREFRLEPGFYSYQDLSALMRLPPPRIDASGYDIVVIDTPLRAHIRRSAGTRVICVVHDLLPLTDLKLDDAATRVFLSRLETSLQQSDELVLVSRYSLGVFRDLLPQFAHLPARVVYPRTNFDRISPEAFLPAKRPSFVVIVSAERRKNLSAVIQAFRSLPEADLVVIGHTGGAELMPDPPANVRISGYVDEREKTALISAAHGLIMPSFAEGFGIPIIEAFALGTPVLCSDIPVFREVAGELADYFDPFSAEALCAAVKQVTAQQMDRRERIRERYADLAERFGFLTQARDFLAGPAPTAAAADEPETVEERVSPRRGELAAHRT
jgi:glycosyltransferase involved in cell wall biosynthesis